jgi:uncharacterized membrane protein YsdA (DUF1294 family)
MTAAIVTAYLVVISVICFAAYARDKRAARAGRWRTRESTLLLLGLVGGWPGGLIAQRTLRHKNRKRGFQAVFWLTAIVDLGVVALVLWATAR